MAAFLQCIVSSWKCRGPPHGEFKAIVILDHERMLSG
jgi:hypothetical protein